MSQCPSLHCSGYPDNLLYHALLCLILLCPLFHSPRLAVLTLCSVSSFVGDEPVLQDGVLLRAGRVVCGDVGHLAIPPDEVGALAVEWQERQLLVPLEYVPEEGRDEV